MKVIEREQALSHPFANGCYDKKNASKDFILGFESYREWLETLPQSEVPQTEKSVTIPSDLILSLIDKCIEDGKASLSIRVNTEETVINVYPQETL